MIQEPSVPAILELLDRNSAAEIQQSLAAGNLESLLQPYLDRPASESQNLAPDSQEAQEAATVDNQRLSMAKVTRQQLKALGSWETFLTEVSSLGADSREIDYLLA